MKKASTWIGLLLAVIVLVPALLILFINTPPGRYVFSSLATRWAQRNVQLNGYIYPLPSWPPSLHVSGLTVAGGEGNKNPNMAEIGRLDVTLSPDALARGNMHIRKLALVDSNIHLERDADGTANWTFGTPAAPGTEAETPAMSMGNLYFENSTLTYLDVPQQTDILVKASTEGDHFSLQGSGKHLGKQFGLAGDIAASCLSRHKGACPIDTTLTVGDTTVHAKGTLSELAPPENADFMVDIKGANASELFPLFGVVLPPTAPYHLSGHLTYESDKWHFDDFSGAMGQSDLQGRAEWDMSGKRPKLTAVLLSRQLRFVDLGPLIGLAPESQQSDEQKDLAAKQHASPYAIPDVPLDISRLSSMDADVEFTGKQVISDTLPLDNFYLKLQLDDRLMTLTPIRFGTANGNISTDMTIDARKNPVSNKAEIRFDQLKLAGLLAGVGKSIGDIQPADGEIGGTMSLTGPGKSLHEVLGHAQGVAGLGMEGGSVSNLLIKLLSLDVARSLGFLLTGDKPLAIRCVVASFDIDQGMMNTDSVVIDTADTNITAEGTVNLDNEKLALRITPAPKNASILSLRSPIDIDGTLKHLDVKLEKGPLAARGAIATGLAVLAPVAAVAAFVEPGLGKDSDCAALLQHMNSKTGRTAKTDAVPKNRPQQK